MNVQAAARGKIQRTIFAIVSFRTSLSIACLLAFSQCLAQPGAVTTSAILEFRGLRFDPLEVSTIEEFSEVLGIDDSLLLRPPQDADVPYWQILQFSQTVDREIQQVVLRELGIQLQLSMNLGGGWIERVSRNTVAYLQNPPESSRLPPGILRASVPYHPAFKFLPELRTLEPVSRNFLTQQRRELPRLTLEALLFPDVVDRQVDMVADQIAQRGGTNIVAQDAVVLEGRLIRAATIQFVLEDESGLSEIAQLNAIRFVSEVGEFIPDNVETGHLTQSGILAESPIWDVGLHGEGQVIGIIDDGPPDIDHCLLEDPDISGNLPGAGHRKVVQLRDASGQSGDAGSHATRVAGSAAGDHATMPGKHPQRGSAWGAKLAIGNWHDFYAVEAIAQCRGRSPNIRQCAEQESTLSTFVQELASAAEHAFIHTNSWHDGFENAGYSQHAVDADNFSRIFEDHLIVGSAGKNWLVWGPPAIAKNTLAVSAAQKDAYPMQWGAGFDNPVPSGRVKPDVLVVGCGIRTAEAGSTCGITDPLDCRTSYSTPHAAGAAAIVRQYFEEGWYPSGVKTNANSVSPSAALLKAMLINSARPLKDQTEFPSIKEGWGVVILDKVLHFEGGSRRLWMVDVRNSDTAPIKALTTGEQHEYDLGIGDTQQPFKVTLVWTDRPSEIFDGVLLNDLDLEVVDPGDNVHLGNDFPNAAAAFATNGNRDSVNNVEQVLIESPATGQWTIRVKGTKIDGLEMQGYALVVTAADIVVNEPAVE